MSNDTEYLDKLHHELLVIMDEIHRLCNENKLKYYLCAGSLLGAVRHNGFIPWDDDLDIMMPRNDFEKFLTLCKDSLSERFYLDWITTDPDYPLAFPKICLRNSLFQQNHSDNHKKDTHWGIYIDVFPIDFVNENYRLLKIRKKIYRKICAAIFCKSSAEEYLSLPKRALVLVIPRKVMFSFLSLISTLPCHNPNAYTRYSSQYQIERVTYPIESFGEGVLHVFENREYYVPEAAEYQLTKLYGSKFMNLPPAEKRRCHYPKKVIFPDGTVFNYDLPEKIVSAYDNDI